LERGIFAHATIGYYLSTARLLDRWGWWTPCWCAGFQDLLRFYPPLGPALLLALLRVLGPYTAPGAAMALALAVLASGLSSFAWEASGRRSALAAVVAPLTLVAVSGWVSTAALYWEFTRILGDGLAFHSLARLRRALSTGERREAAAAGVLAGLAVLSSLISASWLAAGALVVGAWEVLGTLRRAPEPSAALYQAGLLASYVLAAAAVSLWWLVPAVLPWGLGHYMRVHTPLNLKASILADSLSLAPPLYEPAVQALVALVGAAGLAAGWRRGGGLHAALAAALLALSLAHGQGPRLLPVLGSLLVIGGASGFQAGGGRWAAAGLAALLVVVGVYAAYYYPTYESMLRPDYSFVGSDDYRIAQWLAGQGPVRVYAMYGPAFHGTQWLDYFDPEACQVLSGFMEGCLNETPQLIDHYVKDTLDALGAYRLLSQAGVEYIIVDKAWMSSKRPNTVELMEAMGLAEPLESLNRELRYTAVYRLAPQPRPGGCPAEPSVEPFYWTPARILGVLSTAAAILMLWRRQGKPGRAAPGDRGVYVSAPR